MVTHVLLVMITISFIISWVPGTTFTAMCHVDKQIYPQCFIAIMYTHVFMFFFSITLSKCDYFVDYTLVANFEEREGRLAKDDMMLTEEEKALGIGINGTLANDDTQ